MPSRSCAPTNELAPLTPAALRGWAVAESVSSVATERVLHGVYRKGIASFADLENVGAATRAALSSRFRLDVMPEPQVATAADGTRKLLFRWTDGAAVETVLIPDAPRHTVCVSSQVGCAMGCDFCATAALGLGRNLTSAEIVGQLSAARRLLGAGRRVTNVVFMGMGEPLQNYDAVVEAIGVLRADWGFGLSGRRITVSTVGLVPGLERLVQETDVAVAVSLTAANDALRDRLMPVNRRYPLARLAEACRRLPLAQRRRIVFEYVLMRGINDSAADARDVATLLRGIRAKVNLIPFNAYPGSRYDAPGPAAVRAFQDQLLARGVSATLRRTRGDEMSAACGQLAAARG